MKPQSENLVLRLERDLPINGTPPLKWLDLHRTEVESLLQNEPIGALADLTGLKTGTILRWRQAKAPAPANRESCDLTDLAYYRGRAEAFQECFRLLAETRKG